MDTAFDILRAPAILAFLLGIAAYFVRSDLRFPDALSQTLGIYLLFAIGLKGGSALTTADPSAATLALLASLALGALVPLWCYPIARHLGKMERADAASLAAHYGSTSAVTFIAATALLEREGLAFEGFAPAMLALMEVPAIVIGLVFAGRATPGSQRAGLGHAVHHVLVGKSMLLLLGGMAVGFLADPPQMHKVKPLFTDPFAGVLCLFLLEQGLHAAERLGQVRQRIAFLLPFALLLPLGHGLIGAWLGTICGLSVGGATLLATLAASASYIAAPAAMRYALPKADHGTPLACSLGITFPFNLLVGIPLYLNWCHFLAS